MTDCNPYQKSDLEMTALDPNNQQQADKRIIGFDCEFVEPPPENTSSQSVQFVCRSFESPTRSHAVERSFAKLVLDISK